MARPVGAHTAYRPTEFSDTDPSATDLTPFSGVGFEEIRIFTIERDAMLYALNAEPPMRYVYWPFGMTLGNAIEIAKAEAAPGSKPRVSTPSAPKGAATSPAS